MPDRVASYASNGFRAAGVSVALWRVVHPWGELAGADVARSGGWLVAHTFHFLAGAFLCAALPLFLAARRELFRDALGASALVIAFVGSALFAGTGVVTAFFWPSVAEHAPMLVAANGPFFSPAHPLTVISALLLSAGFLLLALTLRRQDALSGARAAVLSVGFVMLLLAPPPLGPFPWAVFVLAGLVAGTGLYLLAAAPTTSTRPPS